MSTYTTTTPVPFVDTLTINPDVRPLLHLPGWMSPSLRRAGSKNTILDQLWLVYANTVISIREETIDLRNNDYTTWTGIDSAEDEFLARYLIDLNQDEPELNSIETDTQKITRLFTLELLRGLPEKYDPRKASWALTAALGRAFVIQGTSFLGADTFIPELELTSSTYLGFDNTSSGSIILDNSLLSPEELTSTNSIPLLARQAVRFLFGSPVAQSRFSPWGRSASPYPKTNTTLHAIPTKSNWNSDSVNGTFSYAIESDNGDTSWNTTILEPGYRLLSTGQVIRPGILSNQETLLGLQTSLPTKVETPKNQINQGNPKYRVSGMPFFTRLIKQIAGKSTPPTWEDRSIIPAPQGPAFDLETTVTFFPIPPNVPSYGEGTVPITGALDHPLASDFS